MNVIVKGELPEQTRITLLPQLFLDKKRDRAKRTKKSYIYIIPDQGHKPLKNYPHILEEQS